MGTERDKKKLLCETKQELTLVEMSIGQRHLKTVSVNVGKLGHEIDAIFP